MQDNQISTEKRECNVPSQLLSPKSNVFTRLYLDSHQRNFKQKTQEVVTPIRASKQEDKYRTQHLMAHILRRHKEAQDRINQLKEQKEKELSQFDFKPKICETSKEILKKIQIQFDHIGLKKHSESQKALSRQETPQSSKLASEISTNKKMTNSLCLSEVSSPRVSLVNTKRSNQQNQSDCELFKSLVEQRKSYYRSLQLHYPGVSTQPCQVHVPECYVNLNYNVIVPPYDPSYKDNNLKPQFLFNQPPGNIGKLSENALISTMSKRKNESENLNLDQGVIGQEVAKEQESEIEVKDSVMKVAKRNQR